MDENISVLCLRQKVMFRRLICREYAIVGILAMNHLLASCLGFAVIKSRYSPRKELSGTIADVQGTKSLLALSSSRPNDEPYHWVVPEGTPFGSLDKLQFRPVHLNQTKTNSKYEKAVSMLCTVSTKAIGLNFADIFCILGLYSAANEVRGDAAFCPGLEYSGVIVEDPTGTFSPGQRVLGFTRFGAYSDIVHVPPYFLHPMPDHWTFVQGAGFLVQALTAWHGLVEIGRLPSLTTQFEKCVVLIHSAAGGVGLWAAEIAARRGATVVGLVGTRNKVQVFEDRILPLSPQSRAMIRGEERTFGRRLADLLSEMNEERIPADVSSKEKLEYLREEGKGVDYVMESLGGEYFTASFNSLNRGGALVTFGSTSYVSPGLSINKIRLIWRYLTRPRIDPGTLTSRNIRLAGFNLIYLTDKPDELRQELRDCISCLNGGEKEDDTGVFASLDSVTPPIVGETFDFRTGTVEALERLKSGTTVGKVVLKTTQEE